jgi:tetratricopeptide (TPR) repeat protein
MDPSLRTIEIAQRRPSSASQALLRPDRRSALFFRGSFQVILAVLALSLIRPLPAQDQLTDEPTSPDVNRLAIPTMAHHRGTTAAESVEEFWRLHARISDGLKRRGHPAPNREVAGETIGWVVDRAAVNQLFRDESITRFIAMRLVIGNRTRTPFELETATIQATIGGVATPLPTLADDVLLQGFVDDHQMHQVGAIAPPSRVTIPAGGVGSTWLIFPELPDDPTVPPVLLSFRLGETDVSLDVTEHQRAVLDLELQRVGPRQRLALLTVGGRINTFNLQSLIAEMEALVTQQVERAVIAWKPTAEPLNEQLAEWFEHTLRRETDEGFVSVLLPSAPEQLRELHVVAPPGEAFDPASEGEAVASRVHPDLSTALAAALRTAYLTASVDEIRQEIRGGSAWSRVAALYSGAARLAADDLALILPWTRDADPAVRRAALASLREFDAEAARERLVEVIGGRDSEAAALAVAALADSRYARHAARLKGFIATADPAIRELVLRSLATVPRPGWQDVLFEYAPTASLEVRQQLLRALVQLNHPRVLELLEALLQGSDATLRDLAFPILAGRSDERSHRLATTYVLAKLDEGELDGVMLEFLARTRDRRALPALERALESATADRRLVLNVLGVVGTESTGDKILARFDAWGAHEQSAALVTLRLLGHPRLLELLERSLQSLHDNVILQAVDLLGKTGTPEAEARLCAALVSTVKPELAYSVAGQLTNSGTPVARAGLRAALQAKEPQRRQAAMNSLRSLRDNSPALSYYFAAMRPLSQRKYKQAYDLLKVAVELDPDVSRPFVGLGDACLKREFWTEAYEAYRRGLELQLGDEEPAEVAMAITGLAIAEVMTGRVAEGEARIAAARSRFPNDALFLYNAACVSGRAMQVLGNTPPSAERDARVAALKGQALADLKLSVQLGFDQIDWMQEDPDLKLLHDTEEFRALVPEQAPRPDKPRRQAS